MIKRSLVLAGLVLAIVFGSLGLTAFATDNPPSIAALGRPEMFSIRRCTTKSRPCCARMSGLPDRNFV